MTNKYTPPFPTFTTLGTSATATAVRGNVFDNKTNFEDLLRSNTRELAVTLTLPNELLAWIGKIATHWAFAEWIQSGTLARLLNIGRKEARVMFGDRIGNCMSKIKQNMEIKNIPIPNNFPDLSKSLTECELARNLLCHGVWMVNPETKEICVQNPSGKWEQQRQPISKRKYPEAFYPNNEWLQSTLNKIEQSISDVQALDRMLDSVLPPYPKTE